jgi:hypothetical protein
VFSCLKISREFCDYPLVIQVTKYFAQLLQALDLKEHAYNVIEFIRDLCEATHNYAPLMEVYDRMATLLKLMTDYERAIVASKKLL